MADGDAEQNELTNRMRHRYAEMSVSSATSLNVYVVMAALAEEVRAYERERGYLVTPWPTNAAGERLCCVECRGPDPDGFTERELDA